MKKLSIILYFLAISVYLFAQKNTFSGMDTNMGNLSKISNAKTRSISPENFTGEKGRGALADPVADKGKRNIANAANEARDLGKGWKVNPFIIINPGETFIMADINGPGAVQHIWMTPTGNYNMSIFRVYYDGEASPSIESPVGPFFGIAWNEYSPLNSLAITVNPGSAFNSFWKMPFRKKIKMTMENLASEPMRLYYQVDYALGEVDEDEAYLHAQYRRRSQGEKGLHTIVDNIKGKGHYVGTYMGVGVRNNGWWGEGEIKFFMDGDQDYATIVGTGTEDYFLGSYNFENKRTHQYEEFTTAYSGLHQVLKPDGLYGSQMRFGMYRWHIMDPIRFEKDLKVTIQDLGWRSGGRYLSQYSDIITVAYWYQTEPHVKFPALPQKDLLEVN